MKRGQDEDLAITNNGLPEGCTLQKMFITEKEEENLMAFIDSQPWNTSISRRVQQYGHEYSYRTKSVSNDLDSKTAPIPKEFGFLLDRLMQSNIFSHAPNQVIVNEYKPGQGIAAHTDHTKQFGPVVVSVSLGHAYHMVLTRGSNITAVKLERCSALIFYLWKHEIQKKLQDDGIPRQRRISITFRTLA